MKRLRRELKDLQTMNLAFWGQEESSRRQDALISEINDLVDIEINEEDRDQSYLAGWDFVMAKGKVH